MESKASMTSTKKNRPKHNIRVAECIRQFELPRQFPSMVTKQKPMVGPGKESMSVMQSKNVQNIISALPLSNNMKFIPNKEINLSNNLQKLKLRSPDGRDLGEFNVEGVGPNSKIMKLTKMVNNSHWVKNVPNGGINISDVISMSNNSNCRVSEPTKPSIIESKIVTNRLNMGNRNGIHGYDQKSFCVLNPDVGIVKEKLTVLPNNPKSKQAFEAYKVISGGQNSQVNPMSKYKLIAPRQVQNTSNLDPMHKIIDTDKIFHIYPLKMSLNHKVDSLNSSPKVNIVYKNVAKDINNRKRYAAESSIFIENKKLCTESNSVNNNLSVPMTNNMDIRVNSNVHDPSSSSTKNVMMLVPNQSTETVNNHKGKFNNENASNSTNMEIIDEDSRNRCSDNEEYTEVAVESEHSNDVSSLLRSVFSEKNATENDVLDEIGILEKAVRSVQDQTLRNKALKALKDCVIGIKKHVPLRRPPDTKVIRDCQTQTQVFSLLEKEEFIEVTEECENVNRIKQTQRMKLTNNISNGNAVLGPAPCTNSAMNTSIEFGNKLDKIIQNLFGNKKEVVEVNNILTRNTVSHAQRVLQQLQKDYEAANTFNGEGLLGIHVAVLSNNMQEVQRHVIVLKAMKKNVDICTEDGKTSLELAVESDCNRQIIKLLLDAGAQPTSSKPIHSSALITASKTAPSLIPLFAEYVTDNDLLNARDENGFAAIHYLAQQGDVGGVNALLKYGADINLCEERSGRTALFFAIENKHHKLAHELLSQGANSNIPNFSRQTVLSLMDDIKNNSLRLALTKAAK